MLLDEHTRLAIARTQLASTEMQLRVESRRFEVAHVQLQVEAEKTGTAKAQLAVEKACRQIRQLDIELELKHASAAAAKPERDAARDVARLVDLDTQATVSQLKKEAAQLQLDGQKERAECEVDLKYQQRQVALSYLGLQQARLRNKATAKEKAEVDLALVGLGVVSPAPCIQEEPAVQFQCTCGFSSDEPVDVDSHLCMHARDAARQRAHTRAEF